MELNDEQLKKVMKYDLEAMERTDLVDAFELILLRHWEQEKQTYIDWWNDYSEEDQEEMARVLEL